MNLILEHTDQVPCFTNMGITLKALKISAGDFDWHVSDLDPQINTDKNGWISGDSFDKLLRKREIQFAWGVFSAFPKGTREKFDVSPFADGNGDFWRVPNLRPQAPGALFEIVSWDASATILIGVNDEAARNFQISFPAAKPLEQVQLGIQMARQAATRAP